MEFVDSAQNCSLGESMVCGPNASIGDRMSNTSRILSFSSTLIAGYCSGSFWTVVVGGSLLTLNGMIGNLLSFIVMLRKEMRKHFVNILLAALAITDFLHSSILFTIWFLPTITRGTLTLDSIFGCGNFRYLMITAGAISNNLLCAVSIARFSCLYFPLKSRQRMTPRNAKKVICILVATCILCTLPCKWIFFPKTIQVEGHELFDCVMSVPPAYIFTYFTLYTYLPVLVITTMSVLIMIKLWGKRSIGNHSNIALNRWISQAKKSSPVLIALSAVFIISVCPTAMMHALRATRHHLAFVNIDAIACHNVTLWAIVDMIRLGNHTLNFYLYCLAGSNFRKELAILFGIHERMSMSTIQNSMQQV